MTIFDISRLLRSPHGLIGIVFIGGLALFKLALAHESLESAGANKVRQEIVNDYLRYISTLTDFDSQTRASLMAQARALRLESVSARGPTDDMIVRVVLSPSPAHPPDMPHTRYFRMSYSGFLGWQLRSDSSSLAYYTTLF